jgi:N-acetylmuramic acid 6-phosphate etherase
MQDRSHLPTEQRLAASMNLDTLPLDEAVALMNAQDARAVAAVATQRTAIAKAVELVAEALRGGGRLIYVGAGTSGRLGVLDASECPPTFRTDPQMVQAIIAGGPEAMFASREGAEDQPEGGAAAVRERNVGPGDVVFGIAAGGTTPFVHGALRAASDLGARTIFMSCVPPTLNEASVDIAIRPLTGPEVITGSTRLKAGTATKLVLNAITTLAMVRLGKVYENLMVDLNASNQKLWDRAARIITTLTQTPRDQALALLEQAGGDLKVAIVMRKKGFDAENARRALGAAGGSLRAAMREE